MDEHNSKNYADGDKVVIRGDLVFDDGARLLVGDQEVDLSSLKLVTTTTQAPQQTTSTTTVAPTTTTTTQAG